MQIWLGIPGGDGIIVKVDKLGTVQDLAWAAENILGANFSPRDWVG